MTESQSLVVKWVKERREIESVKRCQWSSPERYTCWDWCRHWKWEKENWCGQWMQVSVASTVQEERNRKTKKKLAAKVKDNLRAQNCVLKWALSNTGAQLQKNQNRRKKRKKKLFSAYVSACFVSLFFSLAIFFFKPSLPLKCSPVHLCQPSTHRLQSLEDTHSQHTDTHRQTNGKTSAVQTQFEHALNSK